MAESPGAPALGIEGVEWLADGGENLTVRVTGRWWRRRPAWSGQPLLVIEVHGQRHRFPAMPEPPSLTGAAPGTWRMSFSVPSSLAPGIGSRGWLQLGAVVVPLPIDVERASPVDPEPGVLAQAWRPATERGRREPPQLAPRLDEAQRALRVAEQRAHAERMRREEIEEELAELRRERGASESELAASLQRIEELRGEAERLRRRLDEAEQLAATARCARDRAEQQLAQTRREGTGSPPGAGRGRTPAIRAEARLASRTVPPARDRVCRARLSAAEQRLLGSERELTASRAEVRARATRLERELHDYAVRCTRTYALIDELRGQLDAVRRSFASLGEGEPGGAAPDLAEAAPGPARAAVGPSGPVVGPVGPVVGPSGPAVGPVGAAATPVDGGGRIDAARFESARSRLREAAAAPAPEPGPQQPRASAALPTKRWLLPAFRAISRRDPAAAGRLAVALLPAQPLVHRLPLAYDLILADLGCVAVTAAGGSARVELLESPRPAQEVQLRVNGELASLARLLAAGRLRRRILRLGLARAKGNRGTLAALRELVRAPLRLEQFGAAGVEPEPALALALVAAMIEPSWTTTERFTIAHREPHAQAAGACLCVRDGALHSLSGGEHAGPVTTTLVCPAGLLLAALEGAAGADAVIEGDARPLALLQSWCKRAQSG
jgi:hypothetical protein